MEEGWRIEVPSRGEFGDGGITWLGKGRGSRVGPTLRGVYIDGDVAFRIAENLVS